MVSGGTERLVDLTKYNQVTKLGLNPDPFGSKGKDDDGPIYLNRLYTL